MSAEAGENPDEITMLRYEGNAPRMDLDVPHELCARTIRELVRRRWKISEIADYCDASKRGTASELQEMGISIGSEAGPPSPSTTGALLWYLHPSEFEEHLN